MKSIFPCCKTSLKVNPLWRNIKLIFHLYYNGAPYTDVQCRDILSPWPPERACTKKIPEIVSQTLTGTKRIYWLRKNIYMQRRGILIRTPLKAWHYVSKGIDSYNIYKGPEGFYPHCFQVGNQNSERLSHLPVWSHYSSHIEEMGL